MRTVAGRCKVMTSLIVGAALAGGGCASGPERREVVVDFLSVRGERGNTTPALVAVEPNKTDRIRVGVLESSALSLSGQWRASVWLAAFQASLALDRMLSDWTVWVEAIRNGAQFDGPSAGALLTAGMLAGMTGQKVDAQVTMTGTINPDGTIGPVSRIPQKFEAAIASGKTVLGYPLGQRFAMDGVTRQEVDLQSLATHGVSIVEVPDVETAYRLLTGKTLAQATPVSAEAMALSPELTQKLREQTESWLGSASGAYKDWKALNLKDAALEARWQHIERLFSETQAFLKDNEVAAAYSLATLMFIDADAALLRGQITRSVIVGDVDGAAKSVQGVLNNIDGRLGTTTGQIKENAAKSASDLMNLTSAYESLGAAVRHFFRAKNVQEEHAARVAELSARVKAAGAGRAAPEEVAELIDLLDAPIEEVSAANVYNFMAEQNLEFRPEVQSKAAPLTKSVVERLGQLLRIAGNANISYFEQTILAEMAAAVGVSLETMQQRFADPAYRLMQGQLRATAESAFANLLGEGATIEMVRLAEAFSAYVDAAFLIAKYYSLDATTTQDGSIVKLGREAVLQRMLELAEVKARVHAARALKVTGEVPVAARLAYQVARSWQAAPAAHARLKGLQQYWRASMLSQLAVLLRR